MNPRCLGQGLAVTLLLSGCVTMTEDLDGLAPGQKPAIETDEAGLWMLSENYEESVVASGRLETDPALNQYVTDIVCRLSPDLCPDIRVYIVRTPFANATMSANGFMQVWTGLLLRVDNEAQLAYILGHELSHYRLRHIVQSWRDYRNKASFMAYFSLATAAAGVGYVGSIAQLVSLGSVFAFSREHERDADDHGFDLMVKAGYDPAQAPRIWELLEAERKAEDEDEPFIFFATHPRTDERVDTLREKADGLDTQGHKRETDEFLEITRAHRLDWLHDELRIRRYGATEVLLERLLARGEPAGELNFLLGEVYRLRGDDDDGPKAIAAYTEAISTGQEPVETHRSLGLVYWKNGEIANARRSFERYMSDAPEAEDRDMVEVYLNQM